MGSLTDKVAIVTGASKGIGSGIAEAFAAARVALNYSSDRAGAERVAKGIIDSGGKAIAIGADVSKVAQVAPLFKEVEIAFGRLDVLVNKAGVFRFAAFPEIFNGNAHRKTEAGIPAFTPTRQNPSAGLTPTSAVI